MRIKGNFSKIILDYLKANPSANQEQAAVDLNISLTTIVSRLKSEGTSWKNLKKQVGVLEGNKKAQEIKNEDRTRFEESRYGRAAVLNVDAEVIIQLLNSNPNTTIGELQDFLDEKGIGVVSNKETVTAKAALIRAMHKYAEQGKSEVVEKIKELLNRGKEENTVDKTK